MSLFVCEKCGCVENTATSRYWMRFYTKPPGPALCSECDPQIGKWHGIFKKEKPTDAEKAQIEKTGRLLGNGR